MRPISLGKGKVETSKEWPKAANGLLQDGSGAISSLELLGVMRAMGQNPTEDEVT